MSRAIALNFKALENVGFDKPAQPRILRQNTAMNDQTRIGVPMLDDMISLWWSWHDEADGVPNWTKFKPFNHARMLAHIMVYEQIADRFRCSIVGEVVGNQLPMKIAGKFIDEAMPSENLDDITKRLTNAVENQVPNFVEKTMAWHIGYDLVSYRALQLPFTADEGKCPRVLSVMDFRVEKRPAEAS